MTRFIAHFDIARDYTLQFTNTHTILSTVMSSLRLFGRGFQRRTFPFQWFLEQSPASATSFQQQQLTTTEPRFSDCNSKLKLCYDDGQSASLYWCQAVSGAQDQIFVTIRQLQVSSCGAPSLTRERVSSTISAGASAVIFTAVKISSTCHLHLQFYM
jgi:hypothetical protein